MPRVFSKKRPFSQSQTALMKFFDFFMKNPQMSCPYLVQKYVNSLNTTLYYEPKKSIGCLFFSLPFLKKISLISCSCFVKKRPLFKKHRPLMPMYCQKNVNYLKNTMLYFFIFFLKIFLKRRFTFTFFLGKWFYNEAQKAGYFL